MVDAKLNLGGRSNVWGFWCFCVVAWFLFIIFVYIIGMFLCIFFDVFILRWVSEN